MYLVRVTPLMNFTFSDDSLFLKKNLGGGHKFSEFACFFSIHNCYGLEPVLFLNYLVFVTISYKTSKFREFMSPAKIF